MTRFSLHKTRKPQVCGICSNAVPVRKLPDYAEYWKVKGGERGGPKIVCCLCHVLFGFSEDGWVISPDGREVMSASVPAVGASIPVAIETSP